MDCSCPDSLPHNYTVGTFDLFLAEFDDMGVPGADQLIGNVVTGTLEDDTEDFDAFDPLGRTEEPISVSVRTAVRLPFTTDEITCENLTKFFSEDPASAGAADRYAFDVVTRRKLYRVTLEHELPCGHFITVRFHRASVISRASWLFSPDTVHGLAFEIRAFPDDSQVTKFGYLEFSPGTCAVS